MSRRAPLLLSALLCGLALPALAEPDGRLDLYAFGPDGRPVPGVRVQVGQAEATTGPDGVARLLLPAAQHLVTVRAPDGRELTRLTVPVVWGEVTEVVARLGRGPAAPELSVEAPGWPSARGGGPAPVEEGPPGAIAGRLTDLQGRPLAGARVLVRGQLVEARSDAEGAFRLELPAGTHSLSVIHPGFATASIDRVVVAPGATAAVELALAPSSIELDTHRVSGYRLEGGLAALLEERREERGVTEVIGAEQMSKAGDSDAAQALRRVTGLTVVGGRYVYIRGMGERYAGALLDGATLPSPEPERRVVPLDLFPADVIQSITVQKSYSPELPGEFGGGVVRIQTRGIPDKTTFGATASVAYNDRTTGKKGLTYHHGGLDWLGWDDDTRALPFGARIASQFEPLSVEDPSTGQGYPPEVLEAIAAEFPNHWSARRETVGPDHGFTMSFGSRHDVLGTLGWRVGLGYDQGWKLKKGVRRVFGLGGEGDLVPVVDYRAESLTRQVDVSALVTTAWQPAEDQEISLTALLLRTTDDRTEIYSGLLQSDDALLDVTTLEWIEEQLFSSQLRGKHGLFAEVELSWSYSFSIATRYQPDSRRTRYDTDPNTGIRLLSIKPEGNQRLFNELEDFNHDVSLQLDIPFPVWQDLTAHLVVGGGLVQRDRESETRRFKFIHRGPRSRDPAVLAGTPEQVFAPVNLGADGFGFEEITRPTDSYEADQTITAAFVNLIVPLHETLEAALGVRAERSRQQVSTFDLLSRGNRPVDADLDTTDYLPAASLTWRFHEAMQLRLGYGRTLVRPDFRELSIAQFDQVVGAGVFVGNPDLDRTRIDNLDLRWEWYLSEDELVSLGLFAKRLRDPIETIILGGSNRTLTLDNADQGRNLGVELEVRKRLGFIAAPLEPLFLGGNVSYIRSQVELDSGGVATNRKRPLAGQSEYVINLACGWDDPETGTALTLLYNIAGERLIGVGTFGLPDIYEQPVHRLDLVGTWTFWDTWTLKLAVENLLDPEVELTQDGETVESWHDGRTYSFSLGARF